MITLLGQPMIPRLNKYGYWYLNLAKNGKKKSFCIHRLVAGSFVENKDGYDVVNHLDGCRTNNHYLNLEWCTHRRNRDHAYENSLCTKRNGEKITVISAKIVSEIRYLFSTGIHTTYSLAPIYGIDNTRVSDILNKHDDVPMEEGIREKIKFFTNSHKRKLSTEQVLEIRSLYATGKISQRALVAKYKVAKNAIKQITQRTSWKHI